MNVIYGNIWGQFIPVVQPVLKCNKDYSIKYKNFDVLWIMQKIKKINANINVKLKKYASLYHVIQSFLNMKQGKAGPNNAFKLRFDNIYETM